MTVEFFMDANDTTSPFPHYWELCVGSCHAVMGLRQDWRQQLETCHRELGFQYVRFHGLLDEEMSVCIRDRSGKLRYSFFNIDSIFDFLLSIGMKPFIELGFMPDALASGTQTCFHYKANITPPASYEEWGNLVRSLTQHLVDRYSLDEVRQWFFEVWNEPNLFFFWSGTQAEYFQLYEYAARAIKSVDSGLRVGGPATSVNAWIPDMRRFCEKFAVPLDFLSTHHYPTDDPLWKNNNLTMEEFFKQFAHEMGKYERGVLQKMTRKARSEAGDLPLYYTEWNTSAVVPDPLHDEPYAAALVAKTIADNDGLVDGYSFWTFSDLFEENGQYSDPFHGGFGLQTIHGIPKPTYRVFEMLHGLGEERLRVEGGSGSTVEVIAVKGRDSIKLLVMNHNTPDGDIHDEDAAILIRGMIKAEHANIVRIDHQSANPKQVWMNLGCPAYPDQDMLRQIEQASFPKKQVLPVEKQPDHCVLKLRIPAHGVCLIELAA